MLVYINHRNLLLPRNYYADRYEVQLRDFATSMGVNPLWIEKFV